MAGNEDQQNLCVKNKTRYTAIYSRQKSCCAAFVNTNYTRYEHATLRRLANTYARSYDESIQTCMMYWVRRQTETNIVAKSPSASHLQQSH